MLNITGIKEDMKIINNLNELDDEYIFYYDETNNFRKIFIKDYKINSPESFYRNYILGGICFKKSLNLSQSISDLFSNELKTFQKVELKSKNLFKNQPTLLDILSNRYLNPILEWINKNCFIHYTAVNTFYFTILDLVDSFFDSEEYRFFPKVYFDFLKSQIYFILYFYKESFLTIATEVNYPNVTGENVKKFCEWLIKVIDIVSINKKFDLTIFREAVLNKINSSELIFLKNNPEFTVVDSFYAFRLQRCILFDNSYHYFDNEDTDKKLMEDFSLSNDDVNILSNYQFIDSKNSKFIQISDVICKILSRLFEYFDTTDVKDINKHLSQLTDIEKENLKLIISLINKSDNLNQSLLCVINSVEVATYRYQLLDYINSKLQ